MRKPDETRARQTGVEQPDKSSSRFLLHVLTDHHWSQGRDLLTIATAALAGGATVIQLRNKSASTRTLLAEGMALRTLTRKHGALLIVNDRIDVALAVDADGAHVGQDDMPATLARRLLGRQRILGVSATTLAEAEEARMAGADYLGIGPIFSTMAKADAGQPVGSDLIASIAQQCPLPLVAIGGINAENAANVLAAGATGIAVITAVVAAEDIAGATARLRAIVEKSTQAEMP